MQKRQYPANRWQVMYPNPSAISAGYVSYSHLNQQNSHGQHVGHFPSKPFNAVPSPSKTSNTNVVDYDYNPERNLPPYVGPYPTYELQRARESLINSLKHDSSDILQRVKPRLGISSCYGVAHHHKAPGQPIEAISTPHASSALGVHASSVKNTVSSNLISLSQASSTMTSNSQLSSVASGCPVNTAMSNSVHGTVGTVSTTVQSDNLDVTLTSTKDNTSTTNQYPTATSPSPDDNLWESTAEASGHKRKSDGDELDETPSKKVRSMSPVNVAPDQQIYKCDFCNTQDSSKDKISSHLQQAKHFSASLYATSGSKLISVERKLAVRQKNMKNAALVVICPVCNDLFEDIFMCGMHFKYAHGGHSNNGYYAVTPVIHVENVVVNSQPRCQKCNTVFEKQRLLHRHWECEPSHYPLAKNLPDKAIAIFSCLYCNKTFYGDFYACKSHVLDHKDQQGNLRKACALKVTHILKPLRREELLPLSKSSVLDGLEDELSMLRNMKKHFLSMNGTRQKVDLIKQRITFLKQFKEGNHSNDSITS